jgi:Asp-tRNA(Asn)/Glu-tRNA(Gln) amidotransferase A subunit family amidase
MTLAADALPQDPVGAFCRDNHVALRGSGKGPLAGLTMGVKDLFHIAGHRTGFGNPDWLRTHPPATETAAVVQRLLDAGAEMVGKTHTDELASDGDVLVLPTTPRIAPPKGTEQQALEVTYRYQAMCLLCISGLGGLPQINLPLATLDGCPLGLSIVGRRGSDRTLLSLARRIIEG